MHYIGVDLGGTKIAAGIVNSKGKIIKEVKMQINKSKPSDEIVNSIIKTIHMVLDHSNVKIKNIKCIGVGCPGTPDKDRKIIVYNNNLSFNNVQIKKLIQKEFNVPVVIDNDANCVALAENWIGVAKKIKNCVVITLGTGIGCGIIIDKELYRGFNGAASEMGHMVIKTNGIKCSCGRKGCWERYASTNALINIAKRLSRKNPESLINRLSGNDAKIVNGKIVFDAAKLGDKTANEAISKFIFFLGVGIVNLINILQPEMLVIGGGISGEGDYLLNPIKKFVDGKTYGEGRIKATKIECAKLGNKAGIIGAAMLGK